jgi:malate dehydrogenase
MPPREVEKGAGPARIAIVGGGGGVGASVAFNLLQRGNFDVVLVDREPRVAQSHAMDMADSLALRGAGCISVGALEALLDADVVVVSASVPLRRNDSRSVFLKENGRIVAELAGALRDSRAPVVLVTNPVDPLATWLCTSGGISPERVIGYSFNDTVRFRVGISRALGVLASAVEAWVVGEHGENSVPLVGRVKVEGRPVNLTAPARQEAVRYLRDWYRTHEALEAGRTSTWTTGSAVSELVTSLVSEDEELWAASVFLNGEYGITGVCVGVPVTLCRSGIGAIHEWPLEAGESEGFLASAEVVRTAAATLVSEIRASTDVGIISAN